MMSRVVLFIEQNQLTHCWCREILICTHGARNAVRAIKVIRIKSRSLICNPLPIPVPDIRQVAGQDATATTEKLSVNQVRSSHLHLYVGAWERWISKKSQTI